ncbi:hypothetical protein EKD00_02295 [Chlorobium phaeovibrioides]|uniref:Uncharacterized protein n=1 Tax=Chlorobium phaeovibrioides TaxID=1094 RepID=A0A5M8IFK9_CHLPH|nr:hypothetical protein [Chlorobium phaeovibrioides]KAA6233192.1 hypothetical protein FP507_09220 [Chlorobium phaeovibrioides]MDT9546457.1 hypothetical protein [Chlorobium phaeovibrioides]MWV53816.1 hypothetical protein [Chlorobium phaeovibrioides]RTY36591.1 hypothetical protein EKD00_02295 [Chlorobium phaeovibrioides]
MSLKKTNIVFAALLTLLFAGCGGHEPPAPQAASSPAETVSVEGLVAVRAVEGEGSGGYFVVPASAVFKEGAMTGVLVSGASGRIDVRWISAGHAVGSNVVVLAGLSEGELVVGSYDPALREGSTVTKSQAVTEEDQSK